MAGDRSTGILTGVVHGNRLDGPALFFRRPLALKRNGLIAHVPSSGRTGRERGGRPARQCTTIGEKKVAVPGGHADRQVVADPDVRIAAAAHGKAPLLGQFGMQQVAFAELLHDEAPALERGAVLG
jgi:hypothetical protein